MSSNNQGNFFKRHKILTVIGIVILIAIIATAVNGDKSSDGVSGSNKSDSSQKAFRFDDRADKQKSDIEALPNETVTVGDVKLVVSNVEYADTIGEYDTYAGTGKTYLVADLALENASKSTKPYNPYDFRVQTAGGQVLDPAIVIGINTLDSGDLVTGGKVSGKIAFEVAVEDGHQYLIWKPSAFGSARAIIQVK